ncbi:hypothetical protein DVH26_30400 [Paenibacillus sp. H1-7]|nr:hypothetical protein DVH26_30400 [Paenibacillus sp. H1-7]
MLWSPPKSFPKESLHRKRVPSFPKESLHRKHVPSFPEESLHRKHKPGFPQESKCASSGFLFLRNEGGRAYY